MEIISGMTDFCLEKEAAVAIGKFDGVHIGHRRLLEEVIKKKEDGLLACVFTFDPAPAVLFGHSDGKELTTQAEKRLLLERMGVDILIEFPLTRQTAAIPPAAFVTEILVRQMNTSLIAAGSDLSFGAKGVGDTALLRELGQNLGFIVKTIDKVCYEGREVSSSRIRELVENGNMELAGKLLGTSYTVAGRVACGNRIGRTLGFPTVNLVPESSKLLPPNGVYFSQVRYGGKKYRSISNVGYKPTVAGQRSMGVESFIYEFDKEIYGEEIEVLLENFRRPEKRFAGLEELKAQLAKDIAAGKM